MIQHTATERFMKIIIQIFLLLLAINTIFVCKKKEEPKPIEGSTSSDTQPIEEESGPPTREAIPNPTIPSPAGLINIKEAKGDLDGDAGDELVAVYDTKRDGDLGTEREIHIFKNSGGNWKLLHKSIGAVLPSRGGGMMGDPFEDLVIKNKTIIIRHFGGSREKWAYTHRYRFQNENWYLIGATIVFSSPCESSSTYDFNLSTGKVNITDEKETCDQNGEPKGNPKTKTSSAIVKSQKPVLMDGISPGGQEVKLSKDKSFYF